MCDYFAVGCSGIVYLRFYCENQFEFHNTQIIDENRDSL